MKIISIKQVFLILVCLLILQSGFAQSDCGAAGYEDGLIGSGGFFDQLNTALGLIKEWVVEGITPGDPNQITGPTGYVEKKWMSVNDRLPYRIDFENDGNIATASAQNIYLHVPVDKNININSFRLGNYGFGSFNFTVPDNTTFYSTRLDLRDSLNLFVDVTAGIDIVNHEFFWTLKAIDPLTGKTPTDSRGILAISDTGTAKLYDTTNKGRGYANFSIIPQSSLHTGDSIPANASIVFDINDSVPTNTWVNYIDAVAPTSRIASFDTSLNNITLHFSGADDPGGTGVRGYDLYVSDSAQEFRLYKSNIDTTSFTFSGTPGSTYCFFTLATDHTGNKEALKKTCDTSVTLSSSVLPVRWLYFTGKQQVHDALLNWATTSEINTKEFMIERSLDGRQFTDIGTIQATGNGTQVSNYQYLDKDAVLLKTNTLYYRLRQVDKDGRYIYSPVVSIPVLLHTTEPKITAYPNPFKERITLQIITVTPTDKTNWVRLTSIDGKVVYSKKMDYTGNTTTVLDGLPALANGIYILNVSVNGKMYKVRMIKE